MVEKLACLLLLASQIGIIVALLAEYEAEKKLDQINEVSRKRYERLLRTLLDKRYASFFIPTHGGNYSHFELRVSNRDNNLHDPKDMETIWEIRSDVRISDKVAFEKLIEIFRKFVYLLT